MKKALLAACLVLLALALSLWPSRPVSAQSGCCKLRSAEGQPWKKALNLTFEQCRQRNQEQDRGDDLFAAKGRVWWDRNCR